MRVAVLLYDGFTALDAIGPYEVPCRVPGVTATMVAERSPRTGSLVLGAAGLLRGVPATTYWASRPYLADVGAIYTPGRFVEAGRSSPGPGCPPVSRTPCASRPAIRGVASGEDRHHAPVVGRLSAPTAPVPLPFPPRPAVR